MVNMEMANGMATTLKLLSSANTIVGAISTGRDRRGMDFRRLLSCVFEMVFDDNISIELIR